nr:DNA recombination protein RmuC [Sulfurimonas sp. MAG313]
MDYILVSSALVALLVGVLGSYIVLSYKLKSKDNELHRLEEEKQRKESTFNQLESKFETLREENLGLQTILSGMEVEKDMFKEQANEGKALQVKLTSSVAESSELRVRLEEERSQNLEKLELLKNAEKEMSLQFSKLANDIFEQKSKVHAEQNKLQLDTILKPFKDQVDSFGKKIEANYITETKERHLLKDQIIQLRSLNERLSDDANNLTKALKGENKTQGNWGELILEKILENSGLREGKEYETQSSYKDEEGKRFQPDVLIHLPDDKDIIVDSKVSLVAYERYMNAPDDETRDKAKKEHVVSVRSHIKGLSEKRYEDLVGLRSLDFVLLFMPIESAYMLALEDDSSFFQETIKQNIMVVGPSTLLVTLRTIEYIWRNERQEQNAQEIAEKAANLYDKFVGFVEDMEKIGGQLSKTQSSYDEAMKKLSLGTGNLIKRTEDMKKLGIKTKKKIDKKLLENAGALNE